MERKDYVVVNPTAKTITKMIDISLDRETKHTWFDVCSNSFNTLMYFNKNDGNFYLEEKTIKEINEIDLFKEAERIHSLLSTNYIRTVCSSNVNVGASIYRCIFAKAIDDKIYIFDKDQTLFVIYESSMDLKDQKEVQTLSIVTQPYWNIDVDNVQTFDFRDVKQKYGIDETDDIDDLAKKLLLSYKRDYPMPDDIFFKDIKPIFKYSSYPFPFDERLLSQSKKKFNPTYISKE